MSDPPARSGPWLFLASSCALFLELLLIRWAPAVVPFLAYYANLLLISSFLGLGLGALLARRGPALLPWFPLLFVADLSLLLACRSIPMPTSGELRYFMQSPQLVNALAAVGIFLANAALFVPFGQRLGLLFQRHPRPLGAYGWDLGGSLAGTLGFGLFSVTCFSPLVGALVVALGWLAQVGWRARVLGAPVCALALLLVSRGTVPQAVWSPYHHLVVREAQAAPEAPAVSEPVSDLATRLDPPAYVVLVNHFYYQHHRTIDPARFSGGTAPPDAALYQLTYELRPAPRRVLVLGAGGGPDVEAALLAGASQVDAVEIDPGLVALSARFNSARVYEDPRVRLVLDDARAFLERAPGGYDAVVFGYLDSQGLFSSMANVRLDGFVHTVESFRRAFQHLAPGGVLVLGFNPGGQEWLVHKLAGMVRSATAQEPLVYSNGNQYVFVATHGPGHPRSPERLGPFQRLTLAPGAAIDLASDDWPYLYLRQRGVPWDYLLVILTLGIAGALSVGALVRGSGTLRRVDGRFFFLGAGFLLLETKSILDCSLYFGATWLVTTVVVAGVLSMVLLANVVAALRPSLSLRTQFVCLLACLLVVCAFPRETVLSWSREGRLLWTLLAVPLPVFFAGLVFSLSFKDAPEPALRFGVNLIGATLGGLAEYLGMAFGSSGLSVLLVLAYVASAAPWWRPR